MYIRTNIPCVYQRQHTCKRWCIHRISNQYSNTCSYSKSHPRKKRLDGSDLSSGVYCYLRILCLSVPNALRTAMVSFHLCFFCFSFSFCLCMMLFIFFLFFFGGYFFFPSCGVLECSIVHRGVLRLFWSTKFFTCVLIPILLLGKKKLDGLDLSSGVYWSLRTLRLLVYVMHYELLWFLSIYFFYICFSVSFCLCMMLFIMLKNIYIWRFFCPSHLEGI